MPDHLNDPEPFKLRLTKFMLTLELARNTTKINLASSVVDILLRRQILHLILNVAMTKKIKNKIINLNNFTLIVKEILDELEISKKNYNRALSISKEVDLELDLKREPKSCFINKYFDFGLKL